MILLLPASRRQSLTWTQKLSVIIQLNRTRNQKKIYKKKLKQTNASSHLVQYRFKIREGSPEGIRRLRRKGFVKDMSFKSGVKSRGSDRCDEVIRYVQDEVNQEDSEQNEVDGMKTGADSTGKV